jgi:hypothetical protein
VRGLLGAEDFGKQLVAIAESAPKTERPSEKDFGGMWQLIVQAGALSMAVDRAHEPHKQMAKTIGKGGRYRNGGMTHTLKAGDVFVSCWGIDQKHVEFFQVLKTTKKTMPVRKIKTQKVAAKDGLMTGDCIAQRDAFHSRSRPIRKLVRPASHEDGRYCLHFQSGAAKLWDGRPIRATASDQCHPRSRKE